MATVYDCLRLLSACGFRERARLGDVRILEIPGRPGVFVTVEGKLRDPVSDEVWQWILANVTLEGDG